MRIDIGGGVRLFVDVDGQGLVPDGPIMAERPTVLLLHGGPGMDHSLYKASPLSALTEVAQVVYYDHRSQGRSDPRPPDEWTLDMWADDIVRLCDVLGVDKPIVFGASFGGFVAQHYVGRHPDHAGKVILACTSTRTDPNVIGAAFERLGGPLAGDTARRVFAGDVEAMADYGEHCMPLYFAKSAPDLDALARMVMNIELQVAFMTGENTTMDLRAGLAKAQCPVLVIGGELDPVCPIEMNEEVAASLPAELTTFVRIPGASHIDVINEAGAAVREFIAVAPAVSPV